MAEALAYLQQTRQQLNAYKDQLDNLEQQLKQVLSLRGKLPFQKRWGTEGMFIKPTAG